MVRIWGLAALVVAIWLLSLYGPARPDALGLDAPGTEFSAARASAVLGRVLGPETPHPVGSPQNAAVRARLIQELTGMGVQATTQTLPSCWSEPRWNNIPCGTVTNVIAAVTPGAGKQVLLMAHLDSVGAGPGACDDGCGVATLLETIRTLKARRATAQHPIVALFTDGEEAGLLGAAAYFRDASNRARTGVVINMESRGNQGASMLFQTSPGDEKLIDLYGRMVPHVATSSLYAEIYKRLPNDTDLTPALAAGLPGYNFAMIGDVAQYHTPLDRRANIDLSSLQQHGEAATALAQALGNTDFAALKGGDGIYLDVLGRWLPRLSRSWGLPLSIGCFVLIALAGFFTPRDRRAAPRPILAFLMPPLLMAGCIGMGFALHGLAAWISGHADPAFAYPLYLRLSLAFGSFAVALLAARGAGRICGWLWFAGLAIAASIWAPGVAPYFLFPSLVAAPLLLVTVRGGRDAALLIAALPGLVIWIGLLAQTENIMGLKLHELFMASAAFGLLTLLPLLAKARGPAWGWSLALCLVAAPALAATAGLQPAFSAASPQPLNLRTVEQDGKAWWTATGVPHLPDALRAAANFSAAPRQQFPRGYVASAGAAQHAAPGATVTRQGDVVTVTFHVTGGEVALDVPQSARLQSVTFHGVTVPAAPGAVTVICVTPDCGSMALKLASSDAQVLTLISQTRGLPPDGARLVKARPVDAVAVQDGDATMLTAKLAVPAR